MQVKAIDKMRSADVAVFRHRTVERSIWITLRLHLSGH